MKTCAACQTEKALTDYQENRSICRPCRNKQSLERRFRPILKPRDEVGQHKAEMTLQGNLAEATTVSTRIKTLEQLLDACQVDLAVWKVANYTVNSWEQNSVATGITTLYQVKASLQRITAISTEFPEIHPVRIDMPARHLKAVKTAESTGLQGCLIIPDSQNGFKRNAKTGQLDPIHDPRCWDLAIQLAQHTQPDIIVLLGDMLDFVEFGKYTYTPDMAFTTQATLDDMAQTLCKLVLAAPKAKIIYLEGNHELRMEKAICENLKAAYGLTQANAPDSAYPVMSVPHLLGLADLGIEYIGGYPDSIYWVNEALACVHGSTVKQGGGETAKALLKDKPYSVCQGHIHRAEYRALTIKTHAGLQTRYAFSPGTIARIDGAVPAHSKENDWQQGLAYVTYSDTTFATEMIAIDNGKMLFRGQSFSA